ncbi:MAG TPA: ferredoxin family protein [Syntrophorhabdaceae bacterium]|nr:ferredoxin family protein [Syntrophorhabdaceae bacterium]HPP06876.1 ferredoxin family protein [Syntrophorhabdaceae bacterium]
MKPTIDTDRCDFCRDCIDACPNDVFGFVENRVVVSSPEDCIECMTCIDMCSKNAIYMGD